MTSRAATRDAAETPGRIPGPVLTVRRHAEGVGAVTSETRPLRDVAKTAGRLTGPVETVRCRTESNVAALGEARSPPARAPTRGPRSACGIHHMVEIDLAKRRLRAGDLDRRAERDVDVVGRRKVCRQSAEIDDLRRELRMRGQAGHGAAHQHMHLRVVGALEQQRQQRMADETGRADQPGAAWSRAACHCANT